MWRPDLETRLAADGSIQPAAPTAAWANALSGDAHGMEIVDVRADRAFNWSGRRLVVFVDVANILNHTNVRNSSYSVDRRGRRPCDRTRGIIIEDESGRERILIGAPIPAAANRVRTNDARVRKLWGPRYPNVEQYMGFYKDYRHSTNGIVILDENGFDRVAVGDPVPDPNVGRRIGPSTGFVINDEQGFERSGYGLLNVNGEKRVVLGLDSARGQEALTLSLYDEGSVGLSMRDGKRLIYVGSSTAPLSGTGPFHGLLIRGTDGTTFVQNSNTPAAK